jgi:hypothetical protein
LAVSTFMSPVVTYVENDQSAYTAQSPIGAIGGTVGFFQWGPVEEVIPIGDEKSLASTFGLPFYKKSTPHYNRYIDWFSCSNFLSYSSNLRVVRACYPHAKNALVQLQYEYQQNQFGEVTGIDPNILIQQISENDQNEVLVKNQVGYENVTSYLIENKIAFVAKYPGQYPNGIRVSIAGNDGFKKIKDEIGVKLINNPLSVVDVTPSEVTIEFAHYNHTYAVGDKIEVKGLDFIVNSLTPAMVNGIHTVTEIREVDTVPSFYSVVVSKVDPTITTVSNVGGKNIVVYSYQRVGQSFLPWPASYKSLFLSEPLPSEYHVLVIDVDGSISGSGVPDTILEKYESVSIAPSKKYDGSSNYIVNVINRGSGYINVGDLNYLTDDFVNYNFILQGGDDTMYNYAYPKGSAVNYNSKRTFFNFVDMTVTYQTTTFNLGSKNYSHIEFEQENRYVQEGDSMSVTGYRCSWGKEINDPNTYQIQRDYFGNPIYYPGTFNKIMTALGTFSYSEDRRVNGATQETRTVVWADSNKYYIEVNPIQTHLPPISIRRIYDRWTDTPNTAPMTGSYPAADVSGTTTSSGVNGVKIEFNSPHYLPDPNSTPSARVTISGGVIGQLFGIASLHNIPYIIENDTIITLDYDFPGNGITINWGSVEVFDGSSLTVISGSTTYRSRYKGHIGFGQINMAEPLINRLNSERCALNYSTSATTLSNTVTTIFNQNNDNVLRLMTVDYTGTGTLAARLEAWSKYLDQDTVDANLLFMGEGGPKASKWVIDNICLIRKDCIGFVDPYYSDVVGVSSPAAIITNLINTRNEIGSTSYGVMSSAWKYQYDRFNDEYHWLPMSADVAGLCSRVDYELFPWYSPAGLNRGVIKNVIKLSHHEPLYMRDSLYINSINPIVSFPGQGVVLYGDKTLQSKPSAFDRINVRRLFIYLERSIVASSKYFLFEINDAFTRETLRQQIGSFLSWVMSNRGMYAYNVICDESNNPTEVIDRNELYADIFIQPVKSINFIQLNFIATRTGASLALISNS